MFLKIKNLLLAGSIFVCIIFPSVIEINANNQIKYTPDWNSLDTRTIPDWYDKAKIGM